MKKLLAVLLSVFFLTTTSAMAEIGVGITASFASIDSDGKEVELTGDTETTTGSIEEDVEVVEFFAEIIGENGLTIGASYVPTRSLGSKTRTDVDGDDAARRYGKWQGAVSVLVSIAVSNGASSWSSRNHCVELGVFSSTCPSQSSSSELHLSGAKGF